VGIGKAPRQPIALYCVPRRNPLHVSNFITRTVTWVNINRLRPSAIDLDPQGMAAAHQRSTDRIQAASMPSIPPIHNPRPCESAIP
jgi:hypothetical protein